jgi:hypothetical protein
MTETTPSLLGQAITIDDKGQDHLDSVVRGSVEWTFERPVGRRGGAAVPCAALQAR